MLVDLALLLPKLAMVAPLVSGIDVVLVVLFSMSDLESQGD